MSIEIQLTAEVNPELSVSINNKSELSMSIQDNHNVDLLSVATVDQTKTMGLDYELLRNKPKIENHELIGNSTLEDISVHELTAAQAAALFN